jgi:[ribosomal protein S5]-alanine N-acetyltransferase
MLGPLFGRDTVIELADGDMTLRQPRYSDFERWRQVRMASRAFLAPFEPIWADNELTQTGFRARIRRYAKEAAEQAGYTFFILVGAGPQPELVGGVTLSNIRRRAAQAASLGYWMSAEFAGRGLMTRAVGLLLPFVFEELRLHRLEAACLPHNSASIRVLEKNGFRKEGLAENYLLINGKWQDHVLFALTLERYRNQQPVSA